MHFLHAGMGGRCTSELSNDHWVELWEVEVFVLLLIAASGAARQAIG